MTLTNNTALITGASMGIGLELARIHAKRGGDLVLVARSAERLQTLATELQSEFGVKVQVIVMDLTEADAANKIFEKTEQLGLEINTLINNAGLGCHGPFAQRNLTSAQVMMQVNMNALVDLTHLYLQGMIHRKQGRILNVSSTAAFLPGPLQAIYYATKAFVNSFSQAIAQELTPHNVTVTALCPGPVATEFAKTADLEDLPLAKQSKTASSVAECGYKAMERGDLVVFNESMLNFLLNWVTPLLPRKVLLKISRHTMEKPA